MNTNPITPQHIAVIMDGNRRWAKERRLPTIAGHQRVADKILIPLVEHAANRGVKYMTFWAWSTENWGRQEEEVLGIMKIFKGLIHRKWDELHEKGVRIKVIGDISKFDPEIKQGLADVIEQTKNNTRITTIFALNYGGRDEILRAIQKMLSADSSQLSDPQITKEELEKYLDTAGIPDPELVVRTGGEERLSGFLLWQSEYSELYFPSWYMPEFTAEKLDEAIEVFQKRRRRFGK